MTVPQSRRDEWPPGSGSCSPASAGSTALTRALPGGPESRADAMAMQFLVPGRTLDPGRPALGR